MSEADRYKQTKTVQERVDGHRGQGYKDIIEKSSPKLHPDKGLKSPEGANIIVDGGADGEVRLEYLEMEQEVSRGATRLELLKSSKYRERWVPVLWDSP